MCFIMNDKQDWKYALQKDRDDSISVILDTIEISGNNYESHERYLAAIQESYF